MAQAERAARQEIDLTAAEITAMAGVLARRYGRDAAGVALHFAAEHRAVGDGARERAWVRVAHRLRNS